MPLLQAVISQGGNSKLTNDVFVGLTLDTEGTASEFKPIDPFFTHSNVYNPFDGYWYFVIMLKGGAPNNRAVKVFKCSKVEGVIVINDSYIIPAHASITSAYDSHHSPIITLDESNGDLYIAREKGADSTDNSNGHNTDWLVYKKAVADDLEDIVLHKEIAGYFSYPMMWVNGTDIFLAGRGAVALVRDTRLNMQILSTNSATASTDHYPYYTGDTNIRAYCHRMYNYDDNTEKILILNERDDTDGGKTGVHIFKTFDGINYKNLQETYNKDVDASGNMSAANMDDNCAVWLRASADYNINYEGGFKNDGVTYALISRSIKDPVVVDGNTYQIFNDLRLYYFTTEDDWQYKDISEILPENFRHIWAAMRTIQLGFDGTNLIIYVLDKTGDNDIFYEYKSSNLFEDYTYNVIDELDSNNYFFGEQSYNASTNAQRLIILTEIIGGDIYDLDASSNLKLYAPE
ncbi:hypothetical protein ACFS5M_13955 [Lacinutrix iliipiscaria]|uniref:Uncharacterized protein n=1 Tax=Lacinutrix iliipiscaria TaxID=1230532 RepID=A0ABW5WSA0_9FLAO